MEMSDTPNVETVEVPTETPEAVELTKEVKLTAATNALGNIPSAYSDPILSEDWKTWETLDIRAFVLEFEVFVSNVNELRSTMDKAIWAGHSDGTVDPSVSSIRDKPSDDNKRGRKPAELTPAQRALKKLGKLD